MYVCMCKTNIVSRSRSCCTQHDRLLTSYCHLSVCLSVCMWRTAANRYILQQLCQNKQIGSAPLGTRLYNFQPPPTLPPHAPYLLNNRRWCHLVNKLKPYCKQANRGNFHVWNSHRQHAIRLFQTTPYDRLILSNSWASCWSTAHD